MKKVIEKTGKTSYQSNNEGSNEGREHLELLRSSKHFKHVIKKEKFAPFAKLDMMLTKLYLSL